MPLLVGGAGFYLKAVWDGLFQGPPRLPAVRAALQEEIFRIGPEAVHGELASVDPEAARRIGTRDAVRIIRALEVYRGTGRTISEWRRKGPYPEPLGPAMGFGLRRTTEDMKRRIMSRTEAMLEAGFLEEVKRLLAAGADPRGRAMRMVGYAEAVRHLDGGVSRIDLAEAIDRRTWQYARKQMTWFRKEKRLRWFDVRRDESPAETTERILERMKDEEG